MTQNDYLRNILASRTAPPINLNDSRLVTIKSTLIEWAGEYLSELKQSGSSAKGTAVKGITDFDIFISLKSNTPETLKEVYTKLDSFMQRKGYVTRRQNVSLRTTANNLEIDLVPGKIQSGYQNYHSIYLRKKDTWMQTNIDLHVNKVASSGRQEEILLLKIWRNIHGLDFPSIYLELTALEALKNSYFGQPSVNFLKILAFLRDSFVNASVFDPANTNNKISDLLTTSEKEKIAAQAKSSLNEQYWERIIW